MMKEDIGNDKENYKHKSESAAILKNVTNEAKRRPDLLAALIMTWLDEDAKVNKKDALN